MGTILMKYLKVALSLAGSAILLFSCGESGQQTDEAANEAMMTEYSENLLIVMSQNGRKSYVFTTPLVEGYTLGAEPYREFRKGVKITTYKDDSLSSVDAVLTANYAIYYENRELWEAKGNVVVEKSDGKTLYTQQLFWNARTGKIYSNVDSKIVQNGGRDVFIGEGFESDEQFRDWRFHRMKGQMEVDATPRQPADSTERAERDSVRAERRAAAATPQSQTRPGPAPRVRYSSPRSSQPARKEVSAPAPVASQSVPSLQGAAESARNSSGERSTLKTERLELAAPSKLSTSDGEQK